MSETTRVPGRIDATAVPVDAARMSEESGTNPDGSQVNGMSNEQRIPGVVNEASIPAEEDAPDSLLLNAVLRETHETSPWRYLFRLSVVAFVVWISFESVQGIFSAWEHSIWLGLPLAILAALLVIVTVWTLNREVRAFATVDHLLERRVSIEQAIDSDRLEKLELVLKPVIENIKRRNPALIDEFESAAMQRESVTDYISQFENIVLVQLDAQVTAEIRRSALIGGSSVAVLPHPVLDAMVVMWRAMHMSRTIGSIYGLEPTRLASVRLLRQSITSAMLAAGAGVGSDLVIDQVASETAARLFAKLGEGAVIAMRLNRLGNYAQQLCRPLDRIASRTSE